MSSSDWVVLDVGGRKLSTTRSTLTSCPDSVLARMFDPESNLQPAKMVDGVYNLDSDPDCFQVILNWLRYRQLMIPNNIASRSVAIVAEFYGLEDMVKQMQEGDKAEKKSIIVLTVFQGIKNYKLVVWVNGLSLMVKLYPTLLETMLREMEKQGCSLQTVEGSNETIEQLMNRLPAKALIVRSPEGANSVLCILMEVGGFEIKEYKSLNIIEGSGTWTVVKKTNINNL